MDKSADQGGKLKIFIAYSRDDLEFADQLRAALQVYDFAVTIDRESITSGEDWKRRLGELIRDADTIVFVLSPSSARSLICEWEVAEAVRLGKRIVPVVCRALGDAKPPQQLARLNYIFFYPEPKFPGSGFGTALNDLRLVLDADPNWVREHTRYLRLAQEWEEVGKPSNRRLLSGADIELAKAWVANRPRMAPEPTELQLEFITASEAEAIRQKNAEAQRQRELASALAAKEETQKREKEAQRSRRTEEAWSEREEALKREAEASHHGAERARRLERRRRLGLAAAIGLAVMAAWFGLNTFAQLRVQPTLGDALAAASVLIVLVAAVTLFVWKSTRSAIAPALALICIPVAAALVTYDWSRHAMHLLHIHAAPITAMAVSNDENLIGIADLNGSVGVTRTDSDHVTLTSIGDPARALYFVTRNADGEPLKFPELLAVSSNGSFTLYDPLSGGLDRFEAAELQIGQLQTQLRSMTGATHVASAMNKDGIVAVVRAGSFKDVDIQDRYELYFFNRALPALPLSSRPTAIAPYEGPLAGTIMSDAVSQPFLIGFEDGTIGFAWHNSRHEPQVVKAESQANAARKPVVKLASSQSDRIASVDSDGTILVWSLGGKSSKPAVHQDFVPRAKNVAVGTILKGGFTSVAFSPDARRIVTASHDKTARIWDAATGKAIAVLSGHTDPVYSAAFSPDGARVVTTSADKTARIWDAATGRPIGEPLRHEGTVTSAAFSPDARRIVTTSDDNTARIWDAATSQPIGEPLRHEGAVTSVAFSPDARRIVTASHDKTARIWDAATGKAIAVLSGHTDAVHSAAFSPDGARVVTTSDDNTARIWDAATGRPIVGPLRHEGAVTSAAFSPDARRIVTTSDDNTARIWDAATSQPIGEPLRHEGAVTSVAFSPNARRIVTTSDDNTARIWDAATSQPIGEPLRHEGAVTSVAFSPDARRIVTASHDNTARIWDATSGKPILVIRGDANIVTCKGCVYLGIDDLNNAVDTIDGSGDEAKFDLDSGQSIDGGETNQASPTLTTDLFVSDRDRARLFSSDNGSVELKSVEKHLPAHTAPISRTLFLKSGLIVTGSIDGTVRVIDPATYNRLERFDVWPNISNITYAVRDYLARAEQSVSWLSPGSKEEEAAKAKWVEVQNQYQRRADLVPNLAATVQGYAKQEKDVLTEVVTARAKATSINLSADDLTDPEKFKAMQQAQAELSGALGRLLAVSENYPNLKSDSSFLALESQLEGTENRIAVARRDYSVAAQRFNTELRTFPTVLWANTVFRSVKPLVPFTATGGVR